MFIKSTSILLACILLALPNFITAQDGQSINCDPANRPQICPLIFDPVCGWTNTQCLVPPCPEAHRDFSSGCDACSNQDVQWYTLGACPDGLGTTSEEWLFEEGALEEEWNLIGEPEMIQCDILDPATTQCTLDYVPVCGYPSAITQPNACVACTTGSTSYTEGEC